MYLTDFVESKISFEIIFKLFGSFSYEVNRNFFPAVKRDNYYSEKAGHPCFHFIWAQLPWLQPSN